MPIVRSDVETYLTDIQGGLLTKVGKDGTTHNGTNASLSTAIASGLRRLGLVPSSHSNPTDGDVGLVDDTHVERFFKACEYAVLRSVWGNWAQVQERVKDGEQYLNQLADRVQKRLSELEIELAKPYGVGLNRPRIGTQTGGNPIPNRPRWEQYPKSW